MKQFFKTLIVLMCGGLLVLSLLLVCGCENKTANPGKDVLAATESQKTPIPTTTPRPTFAPMPTPVPADTDISSRDHIYDYNAFELPTPEKLRKAVIHEDFIVDRTINGDGTLKRYAEGTNALGDVRGDEVEFYPDGTIKSWHHTDGTQTGLNFDERRNMFYLDFDETGKITRCTEFVAGDSNDLNAVKYTKLYWPNGFDGKAKLIITYNNNGQIICKREYGENDLLFHAFDLEKGADNMETRREFTYGENGNLMSSKETVKNKEGQCFYEKSAEYYDDGSVKNLLEIEYDEKHYEIMKNEVKDGKAVVPEKKDPIVFHGYVIPRLEDITGGPYDRGNEHKIEYKGSGYTGFVEKTASGTTLDKGSYYRKGSFTYTHKDEQGRIIFEAWVNEAEEVFNYREYTYEVKDGLNVTTYVQFDDGKALYTHVEAKDANNKMVYMYDYDGEFGKLARVNNNHVLLTLGYDYAEPCVCWLGRECFNTKTGETTVEEKSIDLKTVLPSIPKVNVNDDWELFIGANADILAISAYVIDNDTAQVKETYQLKDNTGKINSLRELFEGCELSGTSLLEIRCKTPSYNSADSDEIKTEIHAYLFALEG